MLTIEQRLNNLESGIVAANEKMYKVITDDEVSTATEELRNKLTVLHVRLKALGETAATAYSILLALEDNDV